MYKRPEASTDQDKLLDIQFKLADKTRVLDILTTITLCLIVFSLAIAIYVIPDSEFSEQENRYLQMFPKLNLTTLTNGSFTSEIADYFSDQFPARDVFVGIKGVSEIALFKHENNNVTLGKNGYIIKRNGYPDYSMFDKNSDALTKFASAASELDLPYVIALAGRGEDVLDAYLPALYPSGVSEKLWEYSSETFSGSDGVDYLDLEAPFEQAITGDEPEQLYYRTDHHWTTAGAFMAYTLISEQLGTENPLTAADITVEEASDEFYGTTWSSGGMKWIKPDAIEYYRWEGDTACTTEIADTGVSFEGFYDRSYLEKKDKYSSFISGNNARVNVYRTDGTERQKLLVIKDSFAHSVVPFLAHDYDLVILDLRYYKNSVKQLIEDEGFSTACWCSSISTE